MRTNKSSNKKQTGVGSYFHLIRTVFQAIDEEGKLSNRVVAFTSACPGEGVSYVVNAVARELAALTRKRVLAVDARGLQQVRVAEASQISRHCSETQIDNLLMFPADPGVRSMTSVPGRPVPLGDWDSDPQHRIACLKALRWNFDYIVVDCPALRVSADAELLASIVDGVVMVVKAEETRRGQIERALQTLEDAGGNFLGLVLNERRYPVPDWLYQRL